MLAGLKRVCMLFPVQLHNTAVQHRVCCNMHAGHKRMPSLGGHAQKDTTVLIECFLEGFLGLQCCSDIYLQVKNGIIQADEAIDAERGLN